VTQLAKCQTVEEAHVKVKEIYKTICMHVKANRTDHNTRIMNAIITYIDHNYADSMLSSAAVAEELNITPQYLSSFFKKQKGENLTDYIAKIRIEHSKLLLTETKLTVSEIARRIGYASEVGLIRIFKKYEGITPGKYRTNLDSGDKYMN
jgi:YesN/AraC family two-component response regulator